MRNRVLPALACLCALALAASSASGQNEQAAPEKTPLVLVGLRDFDGTNAFLVLNGKDFKALSDSVKYENQALPVAYENLRTYWKEEHGEGTSPGFKAPSFPLKKPGPKQLTVVGNFEDVAAAEAKRKEMEAAEVARLTKAAAEEEKRVKAMSDLALQQYQDKQAYEKDLMERFRKEVDILKSDLEQGFDIKRDPGSSKTTGKTTGKKVGTKQGRRLGDPFPTKLK